MNKHKKLFAVVAWCALASASVRAETLINGAGSSFIEPIATKWFSDFHAKNKNTKINYQAIGSGSGIRQLMAGTVDFAASDDPMKPEEEAKLATPVLHVPAVIGAIVVTYNLPLEKSLKFDSETLTAIFTGEIKTWNDARIAKLNPGVTLPATAVIVAYRSDSSGSTAVFTQFLAETNETFKTKVGQGKTVTWPAGVGGKGNAGVAGIVSQTPGAVGYVELTFALANQMKVGDIKNPAGVFVTATEKSVSAAAASATPEMTKLRFKMSITNSKAKTAYPISAFSWFVVPTKWTSEKGQLFKDFLVWSLSPEAQKLTSALHYAPLPTALAQAALAEVKKIETTTAPTLTR